MEVHSKAQAYREMLLEDGEEAETLSGGLYPDSLIHIRNLCAGWGTGIDWLGANNPGAYL